MMITPLIIGPASPTKIQNGLLVNIKSNDKSVLCKQRYEFIDTL